MCRAGRKRRICRPQPGVPRYLRHPQGARGTPRVVKKGRCNRDAGANPSDDFVAGFRRRAAVSVRTVEGDGKAVHGTVPGGAVGRCCCHSRCRRGREGPPLSCVAFAAVTPLTAVPLKMGCGVANRTYPGISYSLSHFSPIFLKPNYQGYMVRRTK